MRMLDSDCRLKINRLTSSLQMKSPIVEFITPEKNDKAGKKKVSEYTDEDLFDISIANVINNASWKLSDVLLATPITLTHVL
jgi:hypothetical protein